MDWIVDSSLDWIMDWMARPEIVMEIKYYGRTASIKNVTDLHFMACAYTWKQMM